MRFLQRMCFVVLASGMALGQAANNSSAAPGSVADELKALREAIGEQQKQITQQQQQIQTLEQRLQEKTSGTPHLTDASLHTVSAPATTVVQETEKPKESPLSFRIGGTDFTPGGFVDFENIFRTTNATATGGNPIATSFGGIPFSNTVAGHLTEFRSTGQYSRYNLKISGKYGANNVVGYIEGDFNGNDPANVFIDLEQPYQPSSLVLAGPEAREMGVPGVEIRPGAWKPRTGLDSRPCRLTWR